MPVELVCWSATTSANLALVCMPWAGAGASAFRPWAEVLDGLCTVYGVRLPGREGWLNVPRYSNLRDLIHDLHSSVAALSAHTIAIVGVCTGALVGYELALAVEGNGAQDLQQLIVAGQRSPRRFSTDRIEPGEIDLLIPVELRLDAALLEMLRQTITADTALFTGYEPPPGRLVAADLCAVRGDEDTFVSRLDIAEWGGICKSPVRVFEIPGAGHLPTGTKWIELAELTRGLLIRS